MNQTEAPLIFKPAKEIALITNVHLVEFLWIKDKEVYNKRKKNIRPFTVRGVQRAHGGDL